MRAFLILSMAMLASVGPVHVVRMGDVEIGVSTDRARYERGEPVQMELQVRNRGFRAITFEFSTSQRYDFRVLRPDGTLIWQWSHGRVFAQVLGSLVLQPGSEIRFRETWTQVDQQGRPVPPGRYVVEAIFPPSTPSRGTPLALPPRVTIEVVPPDLRGGAIVPGPSEPFQKVFVPGMIRVRFFPWATAGQIERLLQDLDLRVASVESDGRTYVVRAPWPHQTAEKVAALNRAAIVEWAVPHYVLVPRREVPTRRPHRP
ncbi:MAG: BsuPI-related putative proteinase inhibitor [Armatimonadota bacterium]|nr:BsuPI-related putative proteinase inhibitor [Armatimonadota bacterium]MDR7439877.1 BsuPI-related putative proteinase inhibitor [Armatimonadota bacterium]MDR7563328.1 BsuPI-related putative proteinase inhibitor [Armatimonadota bacterium]MDR7567482.1 BsuPI-related putative proteinase inhibitor [Armatimonadota bacterium]MDR7601969.1 BsuPI-related putative proteinase inhibitor [Armatimonadota bacterium]